MRLENQVAIVTGGAQGIGRAIALGLAREGADIVVADLQLDKGAETAGEIKVLGRQAL
ncbi:MAG: SDR family NAD(P)-dependent oxidoreductase, partial [Chloroflexi bacterium]|nr:SDR family NAD(P)-dependent oxidoreductase [Chloroflexota bacterium]